MMERKEKNLTRWNNRRNRMHRKKKVREFPVPSRDVTTKLSVGGNNDGRTEIFLPRGSLVSDIPAGYGKLVNLFLRCAMMGEEKRLAVTAIKKKRHDGKKKRTYARKERKERITTCHD
jgi:hypothetical protein